MRHRTHWAAAIWLIVCGVQSAHGADVETIELGRRDGWVLVNLQATDLLDPKITSTIESGLPSTCLYRIVLRERAGPHVAQRLLEYSLRLDLWEEEYVLETPTQSWTFPSLARADTEWSTLRGLRLIPLRELRPTVTYEVAVEVVVRPLAAADRARVAEFVRQTSRGSTQEFTLDVSGLFSRLLGGARRGSTAQVSSVPFVLGQLEEWP